MFMTELIKLLYPCNTDDVRCEAAVGRVNEISITYLTCRTCVWHFWHSVEWMA